MLMTTDLHESKCMYPGVSVDEVSQLQKRSKLAVAAVGKRVGVGMVGREGSRERRRNGRGGVGCCFRCHCVVE